MGHTHAKKQFAFIAYLKPKLHRCLPFSLTKSGRSDLFLSEAHYSNELLQMKHSVSQTHGSKRM